MAEWNVDVIQKWGKNEWITSWHAAGAGANNPSSLDALAHALKSAFNEVQHNKIQVAAVRVSRFQPSTGVYDPTRGVRIPMGTFGLRTVPKVAPRENVWKLNKQVASGNQGFVNIRGALSEDDFLSESDGDPELESLSPLNTPIGLLGAFADALEPYLHVSSSPLPSVYLCIITTPLIERVNGQEIYGTPIIRPLKGFTIYGMGSRNTTRRGGDQPGQDIGDEPQPPPMYQQGPPVIIS